VDNIDPALLEVVVQENLIGKLVATEKAKTSEESRGIEAWRAAFKVLNSFFLILHFFIFYTFFKHGNFCGPFFL
jgi:hypothetical protein